MGSTSHSPGQGERLLSIGERSMVSLLDQRRQKEADIRDVVYVKPLGRGQHLVKNICNEQEFRVGTALANLTFTPGQMVQVSSHTGHPGEVIIGLPPVGQRGASAAPIILHSRSYRPVPEEEVVVPPLPATLYGFYLTNDVYSGHVGHLWVYTYDGDGGNEVSLRDVAWPNAAGGSVSTRPLTQTAIHVGNGNLLFFESQSLNTMPVLVGGASVPARSFYLWTTAGVSAFDIQTQTGTFIHATPPVMWTDGRFYFAVRPTGGTTWKLWGVNGDLTNPAQVGATLTSSMTGTISATWFIGSNYYIRNGDSVLVFDMSGVNAPQHLTGWNALNNNKHGATLGDTHYEGKAVTIGNSTAGTTQIPVKMPDAIAVVTAFWPLTGDTSSPWYVPGANGARVRVSGEWLITNRWLNSVPPPMWVVIDQLTATNAAALPIVDITVPHKTTGGATFVPFLFTN